MTDPISAQYRKLSASLGDCVPPKEQSTRLKMAKAANSLNRAADHIDAQDAKIKALERGNEYMMAELQKHGHIMKFEWFGAVPNGVDDCAPAFAALAAAKEPT